MLKQLRQAAAAATVSLAFINPGHAGIVGFEDVLLNSTYNVGASFTSDGVSFTMQDYIWPGGTVYSGGQAIINLGFGGSFGTGQMLYPNNINALVDLAGTVGQQTLVTIPFSDNGGNVNFHVNPAMGGAVIEANVFFDPAIDGTVINGVSVSVTGTNLSGFITLTGPVDQVVIGGQETLIDNVRYSPEPTSALLLTACGMTMLARRRQNA